LRDILEHRAANGDDVVLSAGATYTIDDAGDTPCAHGGIDVNASVHITGNGAGLVVDCTGGDADALDVVAPDVVLDHVTITTTPGKGGGGAIVATKSGFEVRNSTIAGNVNCAISGGGLSLRYVDARIVNTTVTGNWSEFGGGVGTLQPTDFTNSTVTGNSAMYGGGIAAASSLRIIYSDVVANSANIEAPKLCADIPFRDDATTEQLGSPHAEAGGAANIFLGSPGPGPGPLDALGSVIAEPINGTNCVFFGTPLPGKNPAWNFSDDDSCMLDGPGDRQSAGDPGLGALGDNGGPTQTLLPTTGSPLLDTVPLDVCETFVALGISTDQRGVTRPQGTACDVGAVEIERPSPPVTMTPPPLVLQPHFTG
jgi:hypothetical protein